MKENTIQIFIERYTELTNSEQQLANYIIDNLDDVIYMNVSTLAERNQVSVATVVRFAQHMGFDGFRALKLYLAKYRGEYEDSISDLPKTCKNHNITEHQLSKLSNANIESFRVTIESIDLDILTKIIRQFRDANKILFFGMGTSYVVCCDACLKFQRVGKTVFSECDLYNTALRLTGFTKTDVVIGISHSGQNESTCRVLQTAQGAGIYTVAITTFPGSKICQYANDILYTKTKESQLRKVSITSRTSQFAAIDALFIAFLTNNHDLCMSHIELLSDYLEVMGLR